VLVPLDIGVRRVALSGADVTRARACVARRLGIGGRAEPEAVPGLAELRAAKARSERRADRATPATAAEPEPPAASVEPAPPPAPPPASPPQPAPPTPAARPVTGQATPLTDEAGAAHEETLAERLARRRRGG